MFIELEVNYFTTTRAIWEIHFHLYFLIIVLIYLINRYLFYLFCISVSHASIFNIITFLVNWLYTIPTEFYCNRIITDPYSILRASKGVMRIWLNKAAPMCLRQSRVPHKTILRRNSGLVPCRLVSCYCALVCLIPN